ncbi:MAG: DUF308 domain-containing protein [Acidobacteriota bacterium]|nr:DUF308 domain-containing protein [Acidobacteriota bacterium]
MYAAPAAILRHATGWSIAWSILLIFFGVLALALPLATTLGFAMIVGWLLVFSGSVQMIHAFQSKGIGHILWKLFVSLLYVVIGFYFLAYPLMGMAAMTLTLAVFFFAEGITDIAEYIRNRKLAGAGWILTDGVVTLLLSVMIWMHWPASSLWVFGILIGISMIMTGWTRLMITLAARKLASHFAG